MTSSCDVCGATDGRVLFSATDHREGLPGSFTLVECTTCGLVRTEPRPDDLAAWYPDSYANHAERPSISVRASLAALGVLARADRRPVLSRLLAWLVPGADLGPPVPAGARVLDVGAGNGGAVETLRQQGLDAWGIEPAGSAVTVAHEHGVQTVIHGTLESSGLADQRWDLIRFTHVLEHVPSPVSTLRTAAAALNENGRVIILVPNFGSAVRRLTGRAWDGLEVPRHLHHFTRSSLTRAVRAAGLEVQSMRTVALFGVMPASLDAWTCGGERQRGWGKSMIPKLGCYPIELALGLLRLGDGIVAIAGRSQA